jgi:hypothetical protein
VKTESGEREKREREYVDRERRERRGRGEGEEGERRERKEGTETTLLRPKGEVKQEGGGNKESGFQFCAVVWHTAPHTIDNSSSKMPKNAIFRFSALARLYVCSSCFRQNSDPGATVVCITANDFCGQKCRPCSSRRATSSQSYVRLEPSQHGQAMFAL